MNWTIEVLAVDHSLRSSSLIRFYEIVEGVKIFMRCYLGHLGESNSRFHYNVLLGPKIFEVFLTSQFVVSEV